jgi:phosphoadenosine phosphosulfate reductase
MNEKLAATLSLLQRIQTEFAPAALATSFGAEDQVLTDLVQKHAPGIGLFTLNTGRLHDETLALWRETENHYGITVTAYAPQPDAVENYVRTHGMDAFYESVELRKVCCGIRKVEPLARALSGKNAWLTGLRREQAVTRTSLPYQEWDETHQLQKFNPLAEWTEAEVWAYIRAHGIPYNTLHDKGFPSIGCAPCTRAVLPGEDIRAGRWWWENPEHKECGLHVRRLSVA